MMTLAEQTYAFFMTILAGGIVGFLFDVYRVIRSSFRMRQLATAVTDLLFWMAITPALFVMLLVSNWAELRLYVAIGLALGLLLYFQALSGAVLWMLKNTTRRLGILLGRIVFGSLRIVVYPFELLSRGFRRLFSTPRRFGSGSLPLFPGGFRPRAPMAWRRLSIFRFFHRSGL